ncbi:MAG TPA: hypothetical protein PLT66_08430, partial [Bacillota bacterium]|nr:hypothetical protein [Bacillota bacterium]
FNTDVRTFAAVIYIVDTAYYEKLLEYGLLAPLCTVCDGDTDLSGSAIDDYGLLYGALNISSAAGFDVFDPESIICIRRMSEGDEYSYISDEEYLAFVDFFNVMIAYTSD